jgi:negative regulator of sigma E activity
VPVDGGIVAGMTELLTVLPPVGVAAAIVAAAAVVVRRLAFAKRGTGE